MSKFEKFLKESSLSEDAKALILEAWEEEKRDMVAGIRDEMKQRVTADRAAIVEGLNKMAQEVIQEGMSQLNAEKQKLVEDRAVIRANLAKFQDFSNGVLATEIGELRQDRIALGESLRKFSQFSNGIIAEEIKEFQKEKQALVETRVKLMAEGRRKLHEAQANWIKHASKSAAKFVEERTRHEFTQLHEQLNEANRNMFGRKIFEAFAAEFMGTQYSESKEIRKLSESIKEKDTLLSLSREKLVEFETKINANERKIRIMEDQKVRSDVIGRLTKPLTHEQRVVMESLLEKTPTEKLNEDFNKYLKPVLNESSVKRAPVKAKAPLVESQKEVTGDRPVINESVAEDDIFNAELDNLAKIAGIRR